MTTFQRPIPGGVGIVGGGLLGLTVAYRLSGQGIPVTVYESSPQFGGLAANTDLGGFAVDRYYHVVLPTDDRVRGLATELGLGDTFRFRRTRVGFYQDAQLASMSSPKELLTFPGINMLDRARLVSFALRCQLKGGYDDLEDVAIEPWMRRMCGDRLWDRLWRPLLDSKFDGVYDDLPATYLWARSRRMASTRDKSSQEVMGTLDGGYQRLVDKLVEAIRARGGAVLDTTPARSVALSNGRAIGIVLERAMVPHDHVMTTQLRPNMNGLLPAEAQQVLGPDRNRYLGVVCLVARVKRSISPFYALNITDRRIPLTTVVETTHVVDPEGVGGTLLYIPKYVRPDSEELTRPSRDIKRDYLRHAQTIFPALRDEDVLAADVARARHAEPVHVAGVAPRVPELFPLPGLAVASSANVYPELVNGQAIIGLADKVAAGLAERVPVASERSEAA